MRISFTMKEAAAATGLGRRTLYELIQEGALKSTTIGRRRLVDAQSLTDLISRGVRRVKKPKPIVIEDSPAPSAGANPAPHAHSRRNRKRS